MSWPVSPVWSLDDRRYDVSAVSSSCCVFHCYCNMLFTLLYVLILCIVFMFDDWRYSYLVCIC